VTDGSDNDEFDDDPEKLVRRVKELVMKEKIIK